MSVFGLAAGITATFAATPAALAAVKDLALSGAARIAIQYYKSAPVIGAIGKMGAELMDESGGSISTGGTQITFKATEILTNSFGHIFSKKHVQHGLEIFGNTEGDILRNIENIITQNLNNLKEGDNFIYKTINGVGTTVTAFVEGGNVLSVNAFEGTKQLTPKRLANTNIINE